MPWKEIFLLKSQELKTFLPGHVLLGVLFAIRSTLFKILTFSLTLENQAEKKWINLTDGKEQEKY